MSKSRYTNDEMDDAILELLEGPAGVLGRPRADIDLNIVFRRVNEKEVIDAAYETRQVHRRIMWLYQFGFLEQAPHGWRIVSHPWLCSADGEYDA